MEEMKNKENQGEIMLEKASKILKIDKINSKFQIKNQFLSLILTENGEEKIFDRVFLHRAFPHELLWEYISVMDEESCEIGLIYDLEDFDEDTVSLLKSEIQRKYYAPVINQIESVKERYGFSYWKVKLKDGREQSFTMQDTYRNILHTGDDTAILVDVDGNRYILASISGLSRKSYRKIEIYL